jgi:hypothetical protein
MQEEVKTTQVTGSEEISGCEDHPAEAGDSTKPEEKPTVDCRDRCMHCGNHCVYLNTK